MELFIGDRAAVFNRLKHSLELLAAPSDFQLRVAPGFGYRADELYLGFEQWRMKVLSNFESELASEQLSCLRSLHQISYRCATNAGPTEPLPIQLNGRLSVTYRSKPYKHSVG